MQNNADHNSVFEEVPYVEVLALRDGRLFHAFFAFRLESIGVCGDREEAKPEYVTRLLNRQSDFIATLPALGRENAVELRFLAQPVPENPVRGRVDVYIRVRIAGPDGNAARGRASAISRDMLPNLLSISDTYHWVPVAERQAYDRAFVDYHAQYLAELRQREAIINLDAVGFPAKQRNTIGFGSSDVGPDEERPIERSGVYFTFPFIRTFDRLDRLFSTLLSRQFRFLFQGPSSPSGFFLMSRRYRGPPGSYPQFMVHRPELIGSGQPPATRP